MKHIEIPWPPSWKIIINIPAPRRKTFRKRTNQVIRKVFQKDVNRVAIVTACQALVWIPIQPKHFHEEAIFSLSIQLWMVFYAKVIYFANLRSSSHLLIIKQMHSMHKMRPVCLKLSWLSITLFYWTIHFVYCYMDLSYNSLILPLESLRGGLV